MDCPIPTGAPEECGFTFPDHLFYCLQIPVAQCQPESFQGTISGMTPIDVFFK